MSDLSSEANYTTRLSDWVSKQGILFQLRHGAAVGGIGRPILGIFIRLVVLAIIVALVGWIVLYKAVGKSKFSANLKSAAEERFGGANVNLEKVSRGNEGAFAGILEIGELTMDASKYSTFEPRADQSITGREQLDLEVQSAVLSPVRVTDGSLTPWAVDDVSVGSLSAKLKLGGESKEEAEFSHSWIFDVVENTPLKRLYIADADLSWGYTHYNLGSLEGGALTGLYSPGVWKFTLADGILDYSWLRGAKVIKANIKVTKNEIEISDAALTMGKGVIKLDAVIKVGVRPEISGSLTFKQIPVNMALREKYNEFIDGSVSGKGDFSGNLVGSKGINYSLNIELEDTDTFDLTDEIPVITALSVIDASANYKTLSFSEGQFDVTHEDGTTSIDNIRMLADNGIVVIGDFKMRPPKEVELLRDLRGEDSSEYKDEFDSVLGKNLQPDEDPSTEEEEGLLPFSTAMKNDSLAAKIRETNRFNDSATEGGLNVKRLEVERRGSDEARDYFESIRRFDGELKLGMGAAAFLRSERLQAAYPFDTQSRKHWVEVPLSGSVKEVTRGTAQALYELGRRLRIGEK